MKKIGFYIISFFLFFNLYGQNQTYTGRIGLNLPGHLDVVITIYNDTLRYEVFNHWYTDSYAELRQIIISINEIEKNTSENDSIVFIINEKSIHLIDKMYRINKQIKNTKLCTSVYKMRKISYAYKIAQENGLMHFDLYRYEDLGLNEDEFCKKVNANLETLKEKIK
jgi:hypothetical protein